MSAADDGLWRRYHDSNRNCRRFIEIKPSEADEWMLMQQIIEREGFSSDLQAHTTIAASRLDAVNCHA